MRAIRKLHLILRAVLRRRQVEREMRAELAAHLASETQDLIARGLSPGEARRRAAATMGRLDLIEEECRDARGTAAWEQFRQDLSFGWRLLLKNRAFSCAVLVTMALGIGSTTAVFSVVDGVLLRPLPFADPDRLYHASDVALRGHFDVLRSNSRLAEYAAHQGLRAFNVRGREWPERVKGTQVSANFFRVLGVGPLIGRDFAEGAERPGAPRAAVLSHAFWMQRYGGRRDVLGQTLLLDDAPFEIVGVMPAGFQYPAPESNFWVPLRLDPRAAGDYWGIDSVSAFARLRPGASVGAARSELRSWTPRVRAMFPWPMPDSWAQDATLVGMRDHMVAGAKTRHFLLLGVVALVLLIALVNVANLIAGQTAARHNELTLRVCMGATAGRLLRQLLTESLLLALAGGALGTLLSFGQLELLKHWLPADTPRLAEVAIDRRMLLFAAAVSLASGLLFGLPPAWRAGSRRSTVPSDARSTPGRMGWGGGAALVTSEAAFATVLLVGAGLLLHSFWTVLRANPGFRAASVVSAEIGPSRAVTASLAKTVVLSRQLRDRVAAYPGVQNAAAMSQLPLTREISAVSVAIEDHPRPPEAPQYAFWVTAVSPEHLDTLGIRLLWGRAFQPGDSQDAPPVLLIGRATARRYWPGASPLGKRIRLGGQTDWRTVVGVVEDVRNYSIAGLPDWVEGDLYVPLAQAMSVPRTVKLVARVAGSPEALEKALPRMAQEVCASCAVGRIARLETVVSEAAAVPRSLAWLVGGFALLALGLAAAGIYGVVNHGVLRRTRELGVRLALGATPGSVAWLVSAASMRSLLLGVFAGLALSSVLARAIRTLLYGVSTGDLLSFALPPVVLAAVALLASLAPMLRAARIDPVRSLRES